jgi:adenylate cyclase
MQALEIQPIGDWLDAGVPGVRGPRPSSPPSTRTAGCGIALARVAVFVRTLHPNVAGRAFFWRVEKPGEVEVESPSTTGSKASSI